MKVNYDGTLTVHFSFSEVCSSVEEALSNILNESRIRNVTVELDDGQTIRLKHHLIDVNNIRMEIDG